VRQIWPAALPSAVSVAIRGAAEVARRGLLASVRDLTLGPRSNQSESAGVGAKGRDDAGQWKTRPGHQSDNQSLRKHCPLLERGWLETSLWEGTQMGAGWDRGEPPPAASATVWPPMP